MKKEKYRRLVKDLTDGAIEAFDNCGDYEQPQTYEVYERAMWVDDLHFRKWTNDRSVYRDAMRASYELWARFWRKPLTTGQEDASDSD